MIDTLVVLVWPLGLGAILVATAFLARRSGDPAPPATPRTDGLTGIGDPPVSPRSARSSIIGLLLILAVGGVVVFALSVLLGMLAKHAGPSIDKPIYSWMIHHRVGFWESVMDRVSKVGDTWTTWAAAAAAAVCLAAVYRRSKWLPPVTLGAAIVLDHYLVLALRHTLERPGPPDSVGGTFPSGGCDRIFVLYGLIAYLVWRELSGSKRMAIWASGVVASMAFSEAYSRGYLTLHWFTDIIGGLIYGVLLLVVFIATIRLVDGPARKNEAELPDRQVLSSQYAPAPQ